MAAQSLTACPTAADAWECGSCSTTMLVYDRNILIAALAPVRTNILHLAPVYNPSLVAARSLGDKLHL